MKAVLDDIVAQLKLCAALMSDAELLREQAHVVAAQFRVAASRIEQLKAYLKKPSKGVSPDKPWFDEAILDGVGGLVDVTLRRHMLPLGKGFEFPKVFEKELKKTSKALKEAPGFEENLLKREIKETNCMGAMILLYYFLYWHVVLILFNYHNHPMCYADYMQEDENGLIEVVQATLEKLPKGDTLLEQRILRGVMNPTEGPEGLLKGRIDPMLDGLYSTFEINSSTDLNSRSSFAVPVWRFVLTKDFCFDEKPEHLVEISNKIHGLLGFCIGTKLDLFGGVISTFELQDDIDKWNDMDRFFQVQSNAEHQATGVYTQYEYRLADILKSMPYSSSDKDFKRKAYVTAVHDYGSVALMVDIAKSFIGLARVVKHLLEKGCTDDVMVQIGNMVAPMCIDYDTKTESRMKDMPNTRKNNTKYHTHKFIQFTPNWRRNVCNISNTFAIEGNGRVLAKSVIDDIAGYYWGAQPCDLIQHNHHYLACPSVEAGSRGKAGMSGVFQALYADDSKHQVYYFAFAHLICLHRNSLFISSACQTLLKLTEILIHIWRNKTMEITPLQVLKPKPCESAKSSLYFNGTLDQIWLGNEYNALPSYDANTKSSLSLSSIRKRLQLELDILTNRVEQAKTADFQKYPGISWPIKFKTNASADGDTGEQNNFALFNPIHDIPRTIPSLAESADGVAKAVNRMSTSAVFSRDFEAVLKRGVLPAGAGAGGTGSTARPSTEAGIDTDEVKE